MQTLLREELAPQALADRLGITATAIRQHLSTLTALGLVERRRQPTGAHRPHELYRASDEGRRIFPKRYDLLLRGLIDVMLDRMGPAPTLEAVGTAARALARDVAPSLAPAVGAERWSQIFAWLEAEFAWEAVETPAPSPSGARVLVHQCPFQDVSGKHPEVCHTYFRELVRALMGTATLEPAGGDKGHACCAFRLIDALPERTGAFD